jgi:small subunit ribosomal protein S20
MPNIKSAEKRLRQSEKARVLNKSVRSAIRTSIRKIRTATTQAQAQGELPTLFSLVDKAARKSQGNIKKNTASNLKRKAHLAISKLPA